MRPTEICATLRKRAEECLRLSREPPSIEHKFMMLGMANAWILLAEWAVPRVPTLNARGVPVISYLPNA